MKVILGCYFYGNGETVEAKRCAIMDANGDGVEINTQQGSYRVHASITSVKSFITFSKNTHTDTVVGVVPSSITGTPILGMTISINNSPYIPVSLTKTPSSNESASTLAHTVQNEPAADVFKMFHYMYQHPKVEYDDRFEKVVDLYIKNIVVN